MKPLANGRPGSPEPSPQEQRSEGMRTIATVVLVAAVIAALHFGQEILIPLALAVLLSFTLAPLVSGLQRLGLPRVPAVLVVVILACAGLGTFAVFVGSQLAQLANSLPVYQQNILGKIHDIQETAPGGGFLDRGSRLLQEIGEELEQLQGPSGEEKAAEDGTKAEPVPVRVEEGPRTPFQVLETVALPVIAPVATFGLVVVLVIFMLLEREDLRDRLIRLAGGDLHHTTEAMDDVARRVSRYLLMQLVVNATYGVPLGVGLWLIGVPNALLWGLLATVLRFIPYAGPFIAALFPLAMAVAVDPGWNTLLWTVALILTMELVSNNFIEPMLYGASTGISTVAILLAAIFWTSLWGPVGLLLSTPMTVCLAVLGRYVPQLAFLQVMLGSEPVLKPEERLYQRMLAGDVEEGVVVAEEHIAGQSLASFYDEVALPALRLAERDRQRRVLTGARLALATDSFLQVVAELAEQDETGEPAETALAGRRIACIAARSGLDAAAAAMLGGLLEQQGATVRVLPAEAVSSSGIGSVDLAGIDLVCLSYVGATAAAHARLASRRLRRHGPHLRIMAGLWNRQTEHDGNKARSFGADLVATSFAEALEAVAGLGDGETAAPWEAPPVPENEDERLAALERLEVLDTPPEERFDRITRALARTFDVPICLVSLVDRERQVWKSATGIAPGEPREAPRETSICGHVVAADAVLVIEDVRRDRRFAGNPLLKERGIRFYAGAPLRTPGGEVLGSLCLIDMRPRSLGARDREMLQAMAAEVVAELMRGPPDALEERRQTA